MAESASHRQLLDSLAETLGLDAPPERIEVYDNSHIQGSNPVGCMIVAGPEGLMKSGYRKFNIRGLAAAAAAPERGGDDYAMMREVLTRRFARALKEDPDRDSGTWPDLVIIDGGKGQLSVACAVFADLGIDGVALLAIAKGPDRNAGRETLHIPGRAPFTLSERDPVLYFLQRLRDEAHRFAIGTHRARRAKGIAASPLDEVPGIGSKRKKALLLHFGSAQAVAAAGLADLEAVDGISRAVARKIYGHFNTDQ
jgi:excinuclease ABC subunit C